LRDILASKEEAFARGVAEGLVEYALGRPVGFSDEAFINSLVKQGKDDGYAFRTFIHAIVNSKQFGTK